MSRDHTKIETITRASVIRGIATEVARAARGRLTFEEAEAAIDSVLPTFDTIIAAVTQAGEPDQRLLAAFAGLGGQRTGDERTAVTGLVVNHAGSLMDLFPGDGEWRAYETLDEERLDAEAGEFTSEAAGHGATPLEALKACAVEARRLYGITGTEVAGA